MNGNRDITHSGSRASRMMFLGSPRQKKKVIQMARVKKFDVLIVPCFLKGGVSGE